MNRCERRLLISFDVTMAILAAFGIIGAIVAAPTAWAVVAIL